MIPEECFLLWQIPIIYIRENEKLVFFVQPWDRYEVNLYVVSNFLGSLQFITSNKCSSDYIVADIAVSVPSVIL